MRIFKRYPVLDPVLVNTKTGNTFSGILWRKRRGYLVLRNARMLRRDKEPMILDGEVIVPAENVDFLQVVFG